jgi:hypothetical protein
VGPHAPRPRHGVGVAHAPLAQHISLTVTLELYASGFDQLEPWCRRTESVCAPLAGTFSVKLASAAPGRRLTYVRPSLAWGPGSTTTGWSCTTVARSRWRWGPARAAIDILSGFLSSLVFGQGEQANRSRYIREHRLSKLGWRQCRQARSDSAIPIRSDSTPNTKRNQQR